jgi:16S rRNA (uracil1498-N3)-methyltransferase
MSLKSVYIPDLVAIEQNGMVRIAGDEHHHLVVARAEPGEVLEAFDGKGAVWTLILEAVSKREAVARVREQRSVEPPAYELILGMALIRMAAFEVALEKAVEIGVTRIAPFAAARSNVNVRRVDRWQKIVIEAAKQSKRYHLPVIDEPAVLEKLLAIPASSKIVFAERGGGSLESAVAGSPAVYLVGPEGGWTDEELAQTQAGGFRAVTLGDGILRAETAAIVGGALIRYELGFGGM